jgi:hypothetical protein
MDTVEQPNTVEADDATGPEAKTAEGAAENHTEAEAVVADAETEAAIVEGEATDADADAADTEPTSATPTEPTSAAAPTPSPTPDPVCWICYETHADQTVDAPSTLVAPCKCSGSLRTVHQECLLAWMAQTDATACPHCHHTYDVDDSYPSTLQRLCDHPWGPTVVAGLVCGALFYAFHRLWVRMTRKRRVAATGGGSAAPGTTATMSGSRLLAMMGGGLPAHLLMLPQMGGGGAGGLFEGIGGAASVSPRSSWNLTGLLAEVEVFALLVMVVYGAARYLHKWGTGRNGEEEAEASQGEGDGGEDEPLTAAADAADTVSRWTTSASAGLEDLWATVDDLWAQSASGSARLSHEEALYTLPLDVLTTLFYVVEHYCKRLQTWGVAKARVVRAWDATQNNLPGSE